MKRMDLKEPKKKRARSEPLASLPVGTGNNGEWRIYTAHLSASVTCIVDPVEMEAVYNMGFFGEGSLSRSRVFVEKKRYGVPPIVRNRQWIRRREWLRELEKLNQDSNCENLENDAENGTDDDSTQKTMEDDEFCENETLRSEMLGQPEKMPAEGADDDHLEESDTNKFGNDKASKLDTKVEEEPTKKTMENKANDHDKIRKSEESRIPKEPEDTTRENVDDDSCSNFVEYEKLERSESKKLHEMEKDVIVEAANSSLELDEEKPRMELTKIDIIEKRNNEGRKNERNIASIDEVLLDSTEDEEICEIVEGESRNDESFPPDDVHILSDDTSKTDKRTNISPNEIDKESTIEEDKNPYELLVLPDSDSDTENYLKNVKPRIENDGFPINETLHLTFEETFFLMYGLGCLQLIHYDGSVFSIGNAWNYFQQQDKYFIQKYVVYHYFRSKGWIVKPGMKFGGDFLLYKQGPPFYHASYIVVIEVMDSDTLVRDNLKSLRKITWKNLIGLERLAETVAKDILFAQILWPSSIVRSGNFMPVKALSEFTVRELLWRRWNPKQKQDIATVDDEDNDSM